jgi:hypothetical protein
MRFARWRVGCIPCRLGAKACNNGKIVPPRTTLLRLKQPSIVRSIVVALVAFLASLRLGGFPDIDALHSSHWQILAVLAAFAAMVETIRCMKRKWSLYQAGVLILLYTDVMIMGLAVFLFFYP